MDTKKLDCYVGYAGLFLILIVGFAFGLGLPTKDSIPAPYDRISAVLGWTYFAAWSISFYPQVYLNWKRKSVVGLSFDFELYNLVGFACYSVFNGAFYWSHYIQNEYRKRHNGNSNAVQMNDVFFAVHAAVLTIITILQCFVYERGNQSISKSSALLCGGIGLFLAVFLGLSLIDSSVDGRYKVLNFFNMLNFLYALSYVKLGISIIKYMPQVILNYTRKSTEGWTIWNVLLDFSGGLLSILQLFIDSSSTNDWTAVTGNPVKFGLGFVSMLFDIIFMTQHFILYRTKPKCFDEFHPLLQT